MLDYEADRHLAKRIIKLRRHWRWVVEDAGACAVAAFVVSLFLPKFYRATTYTLVSDSKIGRGCGDTPWQQMAALPNFIPFVDNDKLICEWLVKFHLPRPIYNPTVERSQFAVFPCPWVIPDLGSSILPNLLAGRPCQSLLSQPRRLDARG